MSLERSTKPQPRPDGDADATLDEALRESFPASDPVSLARREADIDGGW